MVPKRVFIVDDSKVVRQLVRSYVESRLDFVVCSEAVDGRDAVDRVGEVAPDLIILDFCMPRLNGIEAAAILHGRLPRVPIILYTLHKDVVSEKNTRAAGIHSVVSKMDSVEVLLDEILKFVGVARAATA